MDINGILMLTKGFHKTSTIENIVNHSITFAKSFTWFSELVIRTERFKDIEVFVITPSYIDISCYGKEILSKIRPIPCSDPVKAFILVHNEINKHNNPKSNVWGKNSIIHESVIVGIDGMRYVEEDGKVIGMKHMGNVEMGDRVEIGPYSIVHRGTIDSTTVGNDVKIGSHCNIGHNVSIGDRCIFTPKVSIGGSTAISHDCWFGMGTLIRDNIKICARVKTGMNTTITKDIEESGLYLGCPARRVGSWDGKL